METHSTLLALCEGNLHSLVDSHHTETVIQSLNISLLLAGQAVAQTAELPVI